jgi:hypothetical protein
MGVARGVGRGLEGGWKPLIALFWARGLLNFATP